jgi:pyruvate dehydrogenase (quinone)
MTAADVLIETLIDWGVEVIFGLPGDGINGVMESLRTHQDKIRFVQVRHEESAAFMACGYAKFTGRMGVCLATSGPGGIHLLNGLYDAKLDSQPVLAITGLQFHDLIGTYTQQDVALDKLFMDVAVFNERIMGPTHVENITDLACRTAIAYRGVSHITFPVDLQEKELRQRQRSKRNIPHHTSDVYARSARLPDQLDLEKAAEILNQGKKVAILAGRGALGATDELEQTAELLAAPIVKALLGKAAVPDDSPYTTGGIGLLGTKPSQEAMDATRCSWLEAHSHISSSCRNPNRQGECKSNWIPNALACDIRSRSVWSETVEIPLLKQKEDRSFLQAAQAGMKDWWEVMEKRATRSDKPMKPQMVAWELGKRLRDDAIISCDSGTIATWWARHILARRGQMHTLSGDLATMAPGLPYTIAAQVAFPNRQCIAFVGDGGFSMLMADFATAVKYKLPIKVVIIKNNTLGQIKWEQMVFLGNPEYGVDLHPIDFAAFAHACGGLGFTVEDPAECRRAVDEFLNAPGPAVLQAVVDPFEPPMPAKVKADQALHFAQSLARGEPNRKKIALTTISDEVRELI